MRDSKGSGALKLLFGLILLGFMAFVAFVGFDTPQYGSLYDVDLGLDLAGGVSITYEAEGDNVDSTAMADAKENFVKEPKRIRPKLPFIWKAATVSALISRALRTPTRS